MSKEGTKKTRQLTTASGKTKSNEPTKAPATRRKRTTKLADVSAGSSNSSSWEKQSSSLQTPEDCEPAKKQTRKTLKSADVSSLSNSSSSKKQVSSSQAPEHSEPTRKRTRKTLNKKERQGLVDYINKVEVSVLSDVIRSKLSEQCLADHLQSLADALCDEEILLHDILLHHCVRFGELYIQCKQEVDPFLQFQLKWHQHCSISLEQKPFFDSYQLGRMCPTVSGTNQNAVA